VVRLLPVAVLLGAVALSAGCSKDSHYEVIFEAKGAGAATEISYLSPGSDQPTVENNVSLPWQGGVVPSKPGRLRLDVTPAKGGQASCRIVVTRKEMVAKTGAVGQPVTCETVLTKLPDNR
jgi:hypothetical protein